VRNLSEKMKTNPKVLNFLVRPGVKIINPESKIHLVKNRLAVGKINTVFLNEV